MSKSYIALIADAIASRELPAATRARLQADGPRRREGPEPAQSRVLAARSPSSAVGRSPRPSRLDWRTDLARPPLHRRLGRWPAARDRSLRRWHLGPRRWTGPGARGPGRDRRQAGRRCLRSAASLRRSSRLRQLLLGPVLELGPPPARAATTFAPAWETRRPRHPAGVPQRHLPPAPVWPGPCGRAATNRFFRVSWRPETSSYPRLRHEGPGHTAARWEMALRSKTPSLVACGSPVPTTGAGWRAAALAGRPLQQGRVVAGERLERRSEAAERKHLAPRLARSWRPGLVKSRGRPSRGPWCPRRSDRSPAAGTTQSTGKAGAAGRAPVPHRLGRGEQALQLVAQVNGETSGEDAAVAPVQVLTAARASAWQAARVAGGARGRRSRRR